MRRTVVIRLGGLAAMVGGALFVAAPLLGRYLPQTYVFLPAMEALLVVALLLVPLGMVGFHALQGQNYGRTGRAGFWIVVIASLALALGAASYLWWGSVLGSSLLWLAMPVGPLGLLVGFVLYGAATLQAKVLPRWCGVVFTVALPVALALMGIPPGFGLPGGMSITFIVFGVAWLTLGYTLWSRRVASVEGPSRV